MQKDNAIRNSPNFATAKEESSKSDSNPFLSKPTAAKNRFVNSTTGPTNQVINRFGGGQQQQPKTVFPFQKSSDSNPFTGRQAQQTGISTSTGRTAAFGNRADDAMEEDSSNHDSRRFSTNVGGSGNPFGGRSNFRGYRSSSHVGSTSGANPFNGSGGGTIVGGFPSNTSNFGNTNRNSGWGAGGGPFNKPSNSGTNGFAMGRANAAGSNLSSTGGEDLFAPAKRNQR